MAISKYTASAQSSLSWNAQEMKAFDHGYYDFLRIATNKHRHSNIRPSDLEVARLAILQLIWFFGSRGCPCSRGFARRPTTSCSQALPWMSPPAGVGGPNLPRAQRPADRDTEACQLAIPLS
eukprot:1581973-Amphidinium_carterae.1